MSSTPTINDVAKAAGVSLSAVSFVLNGKAGKYRISPTTQARIRTAITQLGFKPDQIAISKAHGEHQPHPIEATPVEPIAQPVVEEIPPPEPEIAIENVPPGIEVDADVPAASAPEADPSISTPVFTPAETHAITPEVTAPAPETPHLNPLPQGERTDGIQEGTPPPATPSPVNIAIETPTQEPPPPVPPPNFDQQPNNSTAASPESNLEPTPIPDPAPVVAPTPTQPEATPPPAPEPEPPPESVLPEVPTAVTEAEILTSQEELSDTQTEAAPATELPAPP
ncbi:MAG: helix-turn-helix domain-containing protein [bacterium]